MVMSLSSGVVRSIFEKHGLPSTDDRAFSPHLTIAKVSKSSRKGVKQIDKETYSEFVDAEFGSDVVRGLELLSMSEPVGEDGYYHCFQKYKY